MRQSARLAPSVFAWWAAWCAMRKIDGQPVLSRDLRVGDTILVFLYRAGRDAGLDIPELQRQMRHGNRGNLLRAVNTLDAKGLVLIHPATNQAHITSKGIAYVETNRLLHPA